MPLSELLTNATLPGGPPRLPRLDAALHAVLDAVPDAVLVFELEEEGAGPFLVANDVAVERYGYSREELGRMPLGDLVDPASVDLPAVLDQLRREGRARVTAVHRTKGGRAIHVEMSARVFEVEGHALVVGVAHDVSRRSRRAQHQAFLAELGAKLNALSDPDAVVHTAVAGLAERLGPVRVALDEVDPDAGVVLVDPAHHSAPPPVPAGAYPLAQAPALLDALARGQSVVVGDVREHPYTASKAEERYLPLGVGAFVTVPLLRGDRWAAYLSALSPGPREWTTDEVALLEAVAGLTWTAYERARIEAALRESEAYLRESEERLRVALKHAPITVVRVDRDLRYEWYANPTSDAPPQPVGQPLGDTLPPEEAAPYEAFVRGAIESGAGARREFTFTLPSGVRTFDLTAEPVRDGGGSVVGAAIAAYDITDVRRTEAALQAAHDDLVRANEGLVEAQQALEHANAALEERVAERTAELSEAVVRLRESEASLRESEERFRLLVTSVRDYAIFMLDPEGHIASWNAGAERIKGYRAEEILGRHFSTFYPQEVAAAGFPEYELRVAASEGRFEDEGWRMRKDGSRFWANVVITAVRDERGELRGFAKVTRDMTERQAAVEALRRSEERYRSLFASTPVGLVTVDVDGRLLEANPAFLALLGYSTEELREKTYTDFTYPDDRATNHTLFREVVEGRREGFQIEKRYCRKDGRIVWALVTVTSERDEGGTARSLIASVQDVTERRRLEQAAVEAAEAERRRISYELHDDLGQQLAGATVLGWTLEERLRQTGHPAAETAGRLRELLRDTVAHTRALSRALAPVDLLAEGLTEALRRLCGATEEAYGLRCHFQSRRAVRVEDLSVATNLFRIAQEAVSNAAKHAGADEIHVELMRTKEGLRLTVHDDGRGTPAEALSEGAGLGLRTMRARGRARQYPDPRERP
ncbi:MAG TPA: PAS domain S-box protein [Rubricoccaceae bacterium]|nr:PAS domain S-box protein [Rubricoccaceae bacterium]